MAFKKIRPKSVYVILNTENNRVKIGVSEDVDVRLANLQNSCGCILDLVFESDMCYNALEIEKKAHKKLSDYRYIGEWFYLDVDQAIATVKGIILKGGKVTTQPTQKINLSLYNKLSSGVYEKDGKMYNVKYINGNWDVNIIE